MQDNVSEIHISVYDTNMQKMFDSSLVVMGNVDFDKHGYSNNTAFLLLKNKISRKESEWSIVLYDFSENRFEIKKIESFYNFNSVLAVQNIKGNIFLSFSDKQKYNYVLFLPKNVDKPVEFSFSSTTSTKFLAVTTDVIRDEFIFSLLASGKVFLFKTDLAGNSKFAKIIDENNADYAFFRTLASDKHQLYLFKNSGSFNTFRVYNLDEEAVVSNSTVYYTASYNDKLTFPDSLKSKLLFKTSQETELTDPRMYVGKDMTAVVYDLYQSEYQNYYNGHFIDRRFYGYRYLRAEIVIFDTIGNLLNQLTMPYDDSHNLHTVLVGKTQVAFLKNGDFLLYYMDSEGLTTYLLDDKYRTKDPIRTQSIPLKSKVYQRRNAEIDVFSSWYDCNNFIISAFQYSKEVKNKKVGYIVNKIVFE